jgi:hypothetical protein
MRPAHSLGKLACKCLVCDASGKDSAQRNAAPAENVIFSIWIGAAFICDLYFSARKTYICSYETRSAVRNKRSAERKK